MAKDLTRRPNLIKEAKRTQLKCYGSFFALKEFPQLFTIIPADTAVIVEVDLPNGVPLTKLKYAKHLFNTISSYS